MIQEVQRKDYKMIMEQVKFKTGKLLSKKTLI